ncbi:recombinase family protein [Candidatus Bipolaricaulota bacterium]
MTKRVVAYIRVSTDEQKKHGFSIETQRQILRDYADGNDLEIAEVIEEAESAYRPGRSGFDLLCKFFENHADVRAVLCYKQDRIARNLSDYARLTEQLGIAIISATEGGETDKLLGGMIAVLDRGESDKKSDRVRQGFQTKAESGIYPGPAPDGYRSIEAGSGKKHIALDPERAPMIRELFDVCLHPNMTVGRLAAYAEKRGFRSRRGVFFGTSSLRYILRNPVYRGDFKWKGKLYTGVHEPLVSKATFKAVQGRLDSKQHSHASQRHTFPYRDLDLLVCGKCGCKITAQEKKGLYVYYNCTQGRGKCEQPYIRQERLADLLAVVVDSVHLTEEQVKFLLEVAGKNREASSRRAKLEIGHLESAVAQIKADRIQAYTDKSRGLIEDEFWIDIDGNYQRRLETTSERLKELRSQRGSVLNEPRAALELLQSGPDLYRRISHDEKARVLKTLVWNCDIDGENVLPHYKKPFDTVASAVASADLSSGLLSNCGMSSRVVPSGTPQRQLWNSSLAESGRDRVPFGPLVIENC